MQPVRVLTAVVVYREMEREDERFLADNGDGFPEDLYIQWDELWVRIQITQNNGQSQHIVIPREVVQSFWMTLREDNES